MRGTILLPAEERRKGGWDREGIDIQSEEDEDCDGRCQQELMISLEAL